MGKHSKVSKNRIVNGSILGALTSGMAISALSSAATAGATCLSVDGIGNGNGCQTTGLGDFAFALGPGAQATAGETTNGIVGFNVAAAIGPGSTALAAGSRNIAVAVGNPGPNRGMRIAGDYAIPAQESQGSYAQAIGVQNRAVVFGDGSNAIAIGGNPGNPPRVRALAGGNTAITVGNGSNSYAGTLPPAYPPHFTNTPNHQLARAVGDKMNAINGINNK
jgi:hypothetical protein